LYNLRNRAISDLVEPGSIFKIITVGLTLKNNLWDLKKEIWGENGKFTVGTGRYAKTIKEAEGHDYGWMTLHKLIAKSSNIGSAKLGIMLGETRLIDGAKEFGFGSKTGIDLTGETSGIVRDNKGDVYVSNVAFGQGIAVTPMQMVKAYSVIANGGINVTPHVVKKIVDEKGNILFDYPSKEGERIIDNSITKDLTDMLRSVVSEGTGTATDISGFDVAGKTGTAQKPGAHGGYDPNKFVSSFTGFFPSGDPKYTIMVVIEEPQGQSFASIVAVPLFRKVANILIQNQDIAPKEIAEMDLKNVSDIIANGRKKVQNDSPKKVNTESVQQIVEPQEQPQTGLTVSSLPDFKGMSLRRALSLIPDKSSDVQIFGEGKIVKQEPAPGEQVAETQKITLWLE
jgi:cell division protein FtsI/penicillin-binding protein 2